MTLSRRTTIFSLALLLVAAIGQAFGLHRTVTRPSTTRQTAARQASPRQRARVRRVRARTVLRDPLFRPSRDSLIRQNAEVDRLELPRIQDDDELEELKTRGELVAIAPTEALRVAPSLAQDRRYCRPWTNEFLTDLSNAFYKEFNSQIQVNSAVRTVKVQKKLRRHNRNAAPEKGELASSHLAGITVDIQRRGMTPEQIRWTERYMLPLKDQGLIEPEEERRQWVFHVMVSDRYSDWRETQMLSDEQEAKGLSVSSDEPATEAGVLTSR